MPGAPSAHERLVCCALGDQDQRPFGGSGIELAWAGEPGFRIGHHLVPMGNPADRAGDGENRREHRRRQPQGAEDDAGIEIDVGIELALDEVIVGEDDALQLHRQLEERIALEDQYFVERKLYPNVDFYSGIIFRALGLPPAMFTPVFAVARTVGWVAHWNEMMTDPETRIVRPRQLYVGPTERPVVPVAQRTEHAPLVG